MTLLARTLRIAGAIIWLAYFLVPTAGGLVDGIPAGPADTIGLILLVWIAAHGVRLHWERTLAVALVVTAAATAALPGHAGFEARYFANATATPPHERGTEHPEAGFTRIDREIAFGPARRDFPLAFFNDNSRFNFYQRGEPHRRLLEFSVTWSGFWKTGAESRTLYLDAPGASAQLFVDGNRVLEVSPQSGPAEQTVTLAEGWRRLHVVFLSPYAAPRQLSAGMIENGARVPFGPAIVRTDRLSDREQFVARALAAIKPIADLAALSWLAGIGGLLLLRRAGELWQHPGQADRAAIALMIAVGAIEAFRYAWPWARQVLLLSGGDDPMTYEGYARDIQFNGLLMNGGRPPGTGEPFYYQAFYPYFLAAAHAIFGEGMFGVLLLQRFFVVLTAAAIVRIAVDLGGRRVWPAAVVTGGLFAWWKFAPIAADLLNESLFLPLLMLWTSLLVRACAAPALQRSAATGISAGLAAITRSTAILSWPLVWIVCAWEWRNRRGRMAMIAVLVAASLGVFSLIGIRNWIVANTFAPTSTELGITLLGGNEPPPEVRIDLTGRREIYERFAVSENTARVLEYAITAPEAFALGLGRKALFALGFYEPYAPGWGYSPVYILVWSSAIAGMAVALRARIAPPRAVILPFVIALTQFVAVVIVYPKGERLILPIHTLLVPYSAIALAVATTAVGDRFARARTTQSAVRT